MLMDSDLQELRGAARSMGFDEDDFTARLVEHWPEGAGAVVISPKGTVLIKRASSNVERSYAYDDSLLGAESAWVVAFRGELASGLFEAVK